MLGMADIWITLAWVLSIISGIFCVYYGARRWNYSTKDE